VSAHVRAPGVFDGRSVLVTGSTSGVGRALAVALAGQGAHLVVHGRDPERLAEVARAVGGLPVMADLSTPDGPTRLVDQTLDALAEAGRPPVSLLVNNAAVQRKYRLADLPAAKAADLAASEVAVDLTAPIQLAMLSLPSLREAARQSGTPSVVVNVTSGLALAPKTTAAVYGAAKAGLRTFTKALRYQMEDEARTGGPPVHVVDAMLPLVATPMTAGRDMRLAMISPDDAAAAILEGLARGQREIAVGQIRLLRRLHRWAPGLAERRLRDG